MKSPVYTFRLQILLWDTKTLYDDQVTRPSGSYESKRSLHWSLRPGPALK